MMGAQHPVILEVASSRLKADAAESGTAHIPSISIACTTSGILEFGMGCARQASC